MTSLAITVVGHDRPGIIAQAAEVLSQCGMNLEDSSMTLLRGHFAMTLICAGEADAARIEAALQPMVNGLLDVTVREVPDEPDLAPLGSSYLLTVHGADRLGIVARLAGVIAEAGGNITDLSTRLSGTLYVLLAEVDLPRSADVDALQTQLADVSAELGVDTTMRLLGSSAVRRPGRYHACLAGLCGPGRGAGRRGRPGVLCRCLRTSEDTYDPRSDGAAQSRNRGGQSQREGP